MGTLRWPTVGPGPGSDQGALFDADDLADHHVGRGEFAGTEFLHVHARSIINKVPTASRMPFQYTINAYRGCSHACSYCLAGETRVLLANGRTRVMADLRPGDAVVGTKREGRYRRYVATTVLDHWSTVRRAHRLTLSDGTQVLASGDHRFLTHRGWKHVTGAASGTDRRPHLKPGAVLLGPGGHAEEAKADEDHRRGYLCGMVRGKGRFGPDHVSLILRDDEAVERTRDHLSGFGITGGSGPTTRVIRVSNDEDLRRITGLIAWPTSPSWSWQAGFLSGVFDAGGSYSCGILRISNTDPAILDRVEEACAALGFHSARDKVRDNGVSAVRLTGGLAEHRRWLNILNPAVTRKLAIVGRAVKSSAPLEVESIDDLGVDMPMYDLTTGTGDFVANGVISHNCFARPTHDYLGLGIGEDFERKIVVKVNAVELLRAELAARRWAGDRIAMGTNTDPYQRCEGKYHLTRGILGVLAEAANPFSVLTKSTLVLRDLDVLTEAARRTSVRVNLSIATLDREVWRHSEPGTPAPHQRVEAVRRLNEAGVPCGVLIAPVLPGLSDGEEQLAEVVDACVDAGAVSISAGLLHLRGPLREHYLDWLRRLDPLLADLTAERYPTAYLPAGEQRALSDLIANLVERRGGGRWAGGTLEERVRRQMGDDAAPAPRPRAPEAEQLGLTT